ncbi:P-loop containing nucleoside triphosphate hydrolase protein [Catenaria anguillulae PL171]|uniref:RNA helicase n=1 Tax=Catenaria anguillulae PL171 TaxID=765915 RepID=A0A1Y2HAH2_9FUNG|nr:P-loop containing nucleoside triphosphate hydrolase protein [Catenaria anguillulae PL171]
MASAATSSAPPDSAATPAHFSDFDLCPQIQSAIASLGFREPTPVQQRAIPLALQGRDVATKARTGSGKTAAYLIPMLNYMIMNPRIEPSSDDSASSASALGPRGLILVPTTELAEQVATMLRAFCKYSKRLEHVNLCGKGNVVQQLQALAQGVELVITTPARILPLLTSLPNTYLHTVKFLVIDEADLLLSFGYQDDMHRLTTKLPDVAHYQTFLASATLERKVSDFAAKLLTQPVYLDLSSAEGIHEDLTQYVIQCPGKDGDKEKFLLLYFILKLKLIKGKIMIFVNSIDRAFRVRLFLEQFAIKSVVLNSELPLNSRMHIVAEFNRGAYDILIATDEGGRSAVAEMVVGEGAVKEIEGEDEEQDGFSDDDDMKGFESTDDESEEPSLSAKAGTSGDASDDDDDEDMKGFESSDDEQDEAEDQADEDSPASSSSSSSAPAAASSAKPQPKRRQDSEHGVSRGIDFHNVTAVINMDMPATPQAYVHRAGRTARGGRKGMVLSLVLVDQSARVFDIKPQAKLNEAKIYVAVERHQKQLGASIQPFVFNKSQVNAFRYRMEDALRAVTSVAVREARVSELKREVLRSEKLRAHFEDHAKDLAFLRRDQPLAPTRTQAHLKNTPAYLLPEGVKEVKVMNVRFHKPEAEGDKSKKRKRQGHHSGGKGGFAKKQRRSDPLKRLKI